jgi:predicted nucleic acid-binding protein
MVGTRNSRSLIGAFSGLMVDTDIWIDFLRGQPQAVAWVGKLPDRVCCSVVSVAELHVGVREGPERQALSDLLATLEITNLSDVIASHGGLLRRDWRGSHGVGLNDSLIASTAMHCGLRLATLNTKHYPMLPKNQLLQPYIKK